MFCTVFAQSVWFSGLENSATATFFHVAFPSSYVFKSSSWRSGDGTVMAFNFYPLYFIQSISPSRSRKLESVSVRGQRTVAMRDQTKQPYS